MSLKEIIPLLPTKKRPGMDDFTGGRRGHSKQPTLLCYENKETTGETQKYTAHENRHKTLEKFYQMKIHRHQVQSVPKTQAISTLENQCKPLKEKTFKKETLTIAAVASEEAVKNTKYVLKCFFETSATGKQFLQPGKGYLRKNFR